MPQLTYYSERSVYPYNLAYRREMEKKNESDFNKFLLEKKPRYLTLSAFEGHPDWVYTYPERHKDFVIPVKAYYQNDQPVFIIYSIDYGKVHFDGV